jgi:hypothetical protein
MDVTCFKFGWCCAGIKGEVKGEVKSTICV